MVMGLGSKEAGLHVLSFLLGAAVPTVFLVFVASDQLGLSGILSSLAIAGPEHPQVGLAPGGNHSINHTAAPQDLRVHLDQSEFSDLAELLPKVAMDDRTVIITSVNEAFARPNSLLAVFRESFQAGEGIQHLLNHVLVVAVDAMAYAHCRAVHPHCYHLQVRSMNLSSASDYMSTAYVELVWTKLSLQRRVLELGYNFLFTDVDIVWFRNPFRHISVLADMTTSSDIFGGDADDLNNLPNTGFYHVKATRRAVEMLRRWQAARARFPPNHEQAVFNEIKHELAGGDLGARIVFLDTRRFGGFCQLFRNDIAVACTMHATCCAGLRNKLHDLRDVLGEWKNYSSLTPGERKSRRFTWRVPAKCGTPDKKST
ncbi:hypothetical protein ACP4OV_013229 [Aristida adscensionis]